MPTSNLYGSTEYQAEGEAIARQRRLADALAGRYSEPLPAGQMAGKFYVPTSPLSHLAQALNYRNAMARGDQADEASKALAQRYQGDRLSDQGALASALSGRPAQPAGLSEDASGNVTPTDPIAARPAGQIDPTVMGSMRTPEMQQMAMALWQQQQKEERIDVGDRFIVRRGGVTVGEIPKMASPDAALRERGANERHASPSGNTLLTERGATERHAAPSGSAILGAQTTMQTHATPSGSAQLAAGTQRELHASPSGSAQLSATVTREGHALTDARAREAADREKFGQPFEGTVGGIPRLLVQNKATGAVVDANTRQPVGDAGPKMGESAQKQQTGVTTTRDAITEYRGALEDWKKTDTLSPGARARMGTLYNNMLLQAKEAYNLGVLNGPDYQILQSVIRDPASLMGFVTSKEALDDQAKKLDQILVRVGQAVSETQTGSPRRRSTDVPEGWSLVGVRGG